MRWAQWEVVTQEVVRVSETAPGCLPPGRSLSVCRRPLEVARGKDFRGMQGMCGHEHLAARLTRGEHWSCITADEIQLTVTLEIAAKTIGHF